MMRIAGLLRTTDRIVVRGALGISVTALAVIVLINLLEIISRTFFHVSYAWIYETNLLLAAWTYFLGIVPVYARNGDVSVVGLRQLLPSSSQAAFDRAIYVVARSTFAIVAWFTWELIELQCPFRTPGIGIAQRGVHGTAPARLRRPHRRAAQQAGREREPAAPHGIGGHVPMISLLSITLFIVLMFVGVPVSASLVLATILCMVAGGYNLILLPQQMGASVGSLELLAIPFFILAANLMTALGMTRRIFDVAEAAVGWMRGGLAHANVVAGVIFSGISGAAVADAAALGSISMKEMPRLGYAPPFAGAVVMAVSTLGPIIPPSIMMVVYAITADVSIARLFVAGILPGFFIAAVISATIAVLTGFRFTPAPEPTKFSGRKLLKTMWSAALALLAPVVILRGMASGWVTPTEAGVLACAYALLVGMLERTITIKRNRRIADRDRRGIRAHPVHHRGILGAVLRFRRGGHRRPALAADGEPERRNGVIPDHLEPAAVHPRLLHRDPAGDADRGAAAGADREGARCRSRSFRRRGDLQPAHRVHAPADRHRALHHDVDLEPEVRRACLGGGAVRTRPDRRAGSTNLRPGDHTVAAEPALAGAG